MNPITLRIIAFLVVCGAAFSSGWQVNGWRKDETIQRMKLAETEAAKASIAAARAKEQDFQHQQEEAQHAAQERENHLAGERDAARNESERLRNDIAAQRARLPQLTEAAVRRYADAAAAVFDECQREYQGMAATADRIDSDRQTLMDAWPK